MIKRFVVWAAVLPLTICGLLPLFYMFFSSLFLDGNFSLAAYSDVLNSRRQWLLLRNSLSLAGLVSSGVTLIGVPLGVLIGKSNLPFKRCFFFILCIPLLVPPYIVAVAWDQLLQPEISILGFLPQRILEFANDLLFGLGGTVFILTLVYLPIPIIIINILIKTINPRLEEAALLNSSWPMVLREITLPLMWPGIVLSAMLTFALTIGEFSVPSYFRFPVFAVESFTNFSALYDFKAATATSIPLAFAALPIIALEVYFSRKWKWISSGMVYPDEYLVLSLGRLRFPLFVFAFTFASCLVLLPFMALFKTSLHGETYNRVLAIAGGSLKRSLLYAGVGATLLSFCGFLAAYSVKKRLFCCGRLLEAIALFLFALPGTVLGIGLIGLWNTRWTSFIYGSMIIVILGYLAKYFIVPFKVILGQLFQLPPSMEEAAQLAGASWYRTMFSIVIPLSMKSILAAWLCGFIFCLRDTGITMLVYPPGNETLPVRIFTTMANGSPQLVASLCVLMVLAAVSSAALLWIMNISARRHS